MQGYIPFTIPKYPGNVQIIHTPLEERPESGIANQGTLRMSGT
jgi:hypothetical protein